MIILFDNSSFSIFGKKYEIHNVIINKKTYWTPLKELIIASEVIGTRDIAKPCKKLATPPLI